MTVKVDPPNSLKMFRYLVHFLAQNLWKLKNPICPMNLALKFYS
jgi:hypothetical protein